MNPAQVTLTLRIGTFGERVESIAIPISESLSRELTEPVELSDEPLSILLASPGLYGGYGDAVTVRKKKFALRRSVAKEIAYTVEQKLFELFGTDDETDGYTRQQLESAK